MFFLIPEDKKVLLFYILIILLGIILEHFNIFTTQKVIAFCMLLGLIYYIIQVIFLKK